MTRRVMVRMALAVLTALTALIVGACTEPSTHAPTQASAEAVSSASSPPTPGAVRTFTASATAVAGSSLGNGEAPNVTASATPTPGVADPIPAAATGPLTPTLSPRPTRATGDTLSGGGVHGEIEDSPCNPRAFPLNEMWFWENAVHWRPTGSVVYFSQGPLVYAAAVDGSQVRLVADASVIERNHDFPGRRVYQVYGPMTSFDVSPEGELVYSTCAYKHDTGRALGRERGYELATARVGSSEVQRLTGNARFDNYPSWSPDGSRIALVIGRSTTCLGAQALESWPRMARIGGTWELTSTLSGSTHHSGRQTEPAWRSLVEAMT